MKMEVRVEKVKNEANPQDTAAKTSDPEKTRRIGSVQDAWRLWIEPKLRWGLDRLVWT